jgi:hypothetical protein
MRAWAAAIGLAVLLGTGVLGGCDSLGDGFSGCGNGASGTSGQSVDCGAGGTGEASTDQRSQGAGTEDENGIH